jgi:alkylhydroperoxidase/carboxymuconolactone decarboxylase family protein YurZ
VFAKRGISANQVASSTELLPIDRSADAPRADRVDRSIGPVAPDLARSTNELLFNDLWRRPDLAPRDRNMITITALIVGGNVDQLPFHLERDMQNGLILLPHNFSSPVSRSIGSATWASRQGFDGRVDQGQAHGCDRVRDVALRPQGRIPWVDNRRVGQASGKS